MIGIALTAIATAATMFSTAAAHAAPPAGKKVPALHGTVDKGVVKDSYIVVLKDAKAQPAAVEASAKALTKRYGGAVSNTYTRTIRGFAAKMSEAQAKNLAANPDVAYVEPNRRMVKSDV